MITNSPSEKLNSKIENDEISLKDMIFKMKEYFHYLISKWLIIFICCLIGCIIGYVYTYFSKPIYTAVTTFVLEDGGSGSGSLGNIGGIASMVGLDLGGGSGGIFQGDNILELYKSRAMIQKTLLTQVEYDGKAVLLVDRYIAFNKLRDKWFDRIDLKSLQFNKSTKFSRLQDSILGSIVSEIKKENLSVFRPDKKLSIIRAQVTASDEFFAKSFNDEIVKTVNDFYIQTKTKKSLENIAILQQKTDSVRSVMNDAIYTSAIALDATPNLNPTRQMQRIVPTQRSQVSMETNKAVLGELIKNLELSKISLRKEIPLIQVVDQPIFPLDVQTVSRVKILILGGFLGGLVMLFSLIVKRILEDILK